MGSVARGASAAAFERCRRCSCHTRSGAETTLRAGDVIRCRECGYRILYKKRTRRVVQYEARYERVAVLVLVRGFSMSVAKEESLQKLLTTVFITRALAPLADKLVMLI